MNLMQLSLLFRQDKQVEMLMRKLAKAEAQIKKLATKNLDEIEDCYIPPDSPVHPSSTGIYAQQKLTLSRDCLKMKLCWL